MKCTEKMLVYDLGEEILCGGEMEDKGVLKMEDFTDVKLYQCKSCKDIKII